MLGFGQTYSSAGLSAIARGSFEVRLAPHKPWLRKGGERLFDERMLFERVLPVPA
jgi:hypothetical protein